MSLKPECKVSGMLSIILHISRIIGIAPLKFERVRDGWRIKASKAYSYYGRILFSIVVTCIEVRLLLLQDNAVKEKISAKVNKRQIVWTIDLIISGSMGLVIAFTSFNRMRVIVHCVAKLRQVSRKLSRYIEPLNLDDRNNKLMVAFFLLMTFVTLTYNFITLIFVTYMTFDALTLILCNLVAIGSMLYVIQFNQIVYCVISSLQQLNNRLKNQLQMLDSNGTILHDKIMAATIRQLGLLYCYLTDVSRMLNDSNEFSLAVLFLSILVQLVSQCYHLVVRMYQGLKYFGSASVLLPLFLIIYQLCKLLLIVEPCHQTHVQIDLTKDLINKMRRYASPANVATHTELEMFYQHVTLNQMSYSPLQLFKINRAVLVAIMRSITTYLVIVVQL